jgi:invasion protein IalB
MNRTTMITANITALLGATMLTAAPTNASAPGRWDITCPAIDTEPLCDIVTQQNTAPGGVALHPAVTEHTAQSAIVRHDCPGTTLLIRACVQ